MNNKRIGLALSALLVLSLEAVAKEPAVLMWDDMVPKEEVAKTSALPNPDSAMAEPEYEDPLAGWDFSRPVESLDGKFVKVPGFIVPLESDEGGWLDEFLLVPYYGACIHTPPPPPNQVVHITLDKPFNLTNMYDPYWITGTIRTQPYSGMMAETVYRMEGQKVEKYDY